MRVSNIIENAQVGIGVSFITATLAGWTIQEWAAAFTAVWVVMKIVNEAVHWLRFGVGAKESDE